MQSIALKYRNTESKLFFYELNLPKIKKVAKNLCFFSIMAACLIKSLL